VEEWVQPVGRTGSRTQGDVRMTNRRWTRAEVGRGLKRQVRRALHAAGYEVSRYGRMVNPAERERWERRVLDDRHLVVAMSSILRQDANCVDVGSYRGNAMEHMARLAPKGSHLAFEPIPWCAAALEGRWPNVDVRRAVVDARSRTFDLDDGAAPVAIAIVSLDDALAGGRVDFLRIDVEGSELRVLQGARATLERWRPVVVFGHTHDELEAVGLPARDEARNRGIHDLLVEELDYRIFDLDGSGPLERDDFRSAFVAARRLQYLAVPARVEGRAEGSDPSIRSLA
jgi:FkbM family methyltransferase